MTHGLSSTVEEVKKFSMAVLLDIVKQSGKYIVYDCYCTYTSHTDTV